MEENRTDSCLSFPDSAAEGGEGGEAGGRFGGRAGVCAPASRSCSLDAAVSWSFFPPTVGFIFGSASFTLGVAGMGDCLSPGDE